MTGPPGVRGLSLDMLSLEGHGQLHQGGSSPNKPVVAPAGGEALGVQLASQRLRETERALTRRVILAHHG